MGKPGRRHPFRQVAPSPPPQRRGLALFFPFPIEAFAMSAQLLLHPAVVDRGVVSIIQLELGRRVVNVGRHRVLVPCRSLAKHGDALAKWQAAHGLADNLLRTEGELTA